MLGLVSVLCVLGSTNGLLKTFKCFMCVLGSINGLMKIFKCFMCLVNDYKWINEGLLVFYVCIR
jgi:hypothetical protein